MLIKNLFLRDGSPVTADKITGSNFYELKGVFINRRRLVISTEDMLKLKTERCMIRVSLLLYEYVGGLGGITSNEVKLLFNDATITSLINGCPNDYTEWNNFLNTQLSSNSPITSQTNLNNTTITEPEYLRLAKTTDWHTTHTGLLSPNLQEYTGCNNNTTLNIAVQNALNDIPFVNHIKRSFGIEYEMGRHDYEFLPSTEVGRELRKLLKYMPSSIMSHDGTVGIEVIFIPVDEVDFINIVKIMKKFVEYHNIDMSNTGMHTTYGYIDELNPINSNRDDIQLRCNRFSYAIHTLSTKAQQRELFGRAIGDSTYAELPSSFTRNVHSNMISMHGRSGNKCFEFRLSKYNCNPEKFVIFLHGMDSVFKRPFNNEDFTKVYEAFGFVGDGI